MARGEYHRLPTAEECARALVLAASVTGELGRVMVSPVAALSGAMPTQARWLAIATVQAMHFKVRPGDIAQLFGVADPSGSIVGMAQRNGTWSREGAVALLAALCEAAPGERLGASLHRLHSIWPRW